MRKPEQQVLLSLLLIYAVATLVHFTHNAEYLAEYPNLPLSWSRAGVYGAWIAMTLVGVIGWLLVSRGWVLTGLCFLVGYALFGLDSLGHYVVAPFSAHTLTMNATILVEIVAAGLLLVEVMRQIARRMIDRASKRNA